MDIWKESTESKFYGDRKLDNFKYFLLICVCLNIHLLSPCFVSVTAYTHVFSILKIYIDKQHMYTWP